MSELQPGDIISMSIAPRVRLTQYVSVHAHAHIKRTLGDDPEADIAKMEASLTRIIHRSIAIELGVLASVTAVVKKLDTLEQIAEHCMEVWKHGEQEEDESCETTYRGGEIQSRRKGEGRKKGSKKKVRKKGKRKARPVPY